MEKQKALSGIAQGYGKESGCSFVYTATRRRPERGRMIIAAMMMARRLMWLTRTGTTAARPLCVHPNSYQRPR